MSFRRLPRVAVLVALGALAVPLLGPAPADAALTDASAKGIALLADSAGCAISASASKGITKPLADNGAGVTVADRRTATVTGSTASDTVALAGAVSSTTTISPITAAGGTVRFTASATASAVQQAAESDCDARATAGADSGATVRLPGAMWAFATIGGSGDISAEVEVGNDIHQYYANGIGKGTASATYLMPAGSIDVETTASVVALQGDGTLSGSASITIALRPVGSASAISGRGQRFVVPGARSCSAGSIGVRLTKAVRRAKRVDVRVNGVRRLHAAGKRIRPRSLTLGVPATSAATVTAVITPRHGRRVAVTRSYLACA